MMEELYEGALVYDCIDTIDSVDFICEQKDTSYLSKCFIAIFDPAVPRNQMMEEIIEAVKCSFTEDEE